MYSSQGSAQFPPACNSRVPGHGLKQRRIEAAKTPLSFIDTCGIFAAVSVAFQESIVQFLLGFLLQLAAKATCEIGRKPSRSGTARKWILWFLRNPYSSSDVAIAIHSVDYGAPRFLRRPCAFSIVRRQTRCNHMPIVFLFSGPKKQCARQRP